MKNIQLKKKSAPSLICLFRIKYYQLNFSTYCIRFSILSIFISQFPPIGVKCYIKHGEKGDVMMGSLCYLMRVAFTFLFCVCSSKENSLLPWVHFSFACLLLFLPFLSFFFTPLWNTSTNKLPNEIYCC